MLHYPVFLYKRNGIATIIIAKNCSRKLDKIQTVQHVKLGTTKHLLSSKPHSLRYPVFQRDIKIFYKEGFSRLYHHKVFGDDDDD